MIDEDTKIKMLTAISKADITLSLLFLKFGDAVVTLEDCLEYTSFKTIEAAYKAANQGRLELPTFRMTDSTKASRFVSIHDLARHIDAKREEAKRFNDLMSGKLTKIKIISPAPRRKRNNAKPDHVMLA